MSNDVPDSSTWFHTQWTTTIESNDSLQRQLVEQRYQTEQLRLLGTAVHITGQGIAILTPAVEAIGPRVAFVNDGFCAIYGRPREEIIGQTPEIFSIVERHGAIFDALLRPVFERKSFDAEVTAQRKDCSELEVDIQLVPVEDGGQLSHWV